jgi:hypothetical protein
LLYILTEEGVAMELNNSNFCEKECQNKCYIKLKDTTLVQRLCTKALRGTFSNCVKIVEQEIKKYNITIEEFYKLRDTKIDFNDKLNSPIIMKIRRSIENPGYDDIFEKAMTEMTFNKYVKETGFILGFVSLEKYLASKTSIDYIKDLALPPKTFKSNHPIILVRFILDNPIDLKKLIIPFDEPGKKIYTEPCKGNGFTASKNENISPEYRFVEEAVVGLGSQALKIYPDGNEKLLRVFDPDAKKFVKYKGVTIVKIDDKYFEVDKNGNKTPIEINESATEIIEFLP